MSIHIPPKTNLGFAIAFILIASFFNATMSAVVKFSYSALNTLEMVFARNFVSLILFFGWLLFTHQEKTIFAFLKTSSIKMQLIRALAGLASVTLFMYSLGKTNLSDATVLFNTMPIFVPIVAFLWKGTKIHHKLWWGMGAAFLGIIVIVQPGAGFLQIGSLTALLSGVAGAISTLALRYSHYTEPTGRTIFYYFLIATIVTALALPFDEGGASRMLSKDGLFLLGLIGVIGLVFQVFFTLATKYAPARLISPFYYAAVVFSMIYDSLLWNLKIGFWELFGFVLVFIGVCLVVLLYPKEVVVSKPGNQ